jgi:type I restriction enzyme R subunit
VGLESPTSFMFLNPDQPISKHGGKLPHWQQGEVFIFVTWRLGDSIPQAKLKMWQEEREAWLVHHPFPWSDAVEAEYHERFSQRVDEWLDAGEGSCVLRDPLLAKVVADAFQHFNVERYQLDCFVVMPNHVHVIFQTAPNHELEDVIQSWKGFTGRKINEHLKKNGALWQNGYWDRILRHEEHRWKCREYIKNNPTVAKLRPGEYSLWQA